MITPLRFVHCFPRRVVVTAAVLFASLIACSSISGGYAPYSYWKNNGSGYTDTQLAANQWIVTYRGNSLTDRAKALDFTLLRAADLTLASGNKYFTVAQAEDATTHTSAVLPGQTATTATGTATCSSVGTSTSCSGLATTTTTGTPAHVVGFTQPGTMLRIVAYPNQPAGVEAMDASVVSRSVRAKYGIK